MPELPERAIDAIQTILSKVEGIEDAPLQVDYPNHVDTMLTPLALSRIGEGTEVSLYCKNSEVELIVTITVLLNPLGQGNYGEMTVQAHQIFGAIRARFRNGATYLYGDQDVTAAAQQKLLIEESTMELYVNTAVPMRYSGYRVQQYPENSQNWFHAFEVVLSLKGRDGSGDC